MPERSEMHQESLPQGNMPQEDIFDIAIVGGGPAGYTAAIRAGQYGLKVALIEVTSKLGGTCLHWGCIPTKALLFHAELWEHVQHGGDYGIENLGTPTLNWPRVLERKSTIVQKHTKGLDFLMKKNKVTVVHGHGRLTGPAQDGVFSVAVSAPDSPTQTVRARNVFLASGSDAKMLPGLKPDDRILTNMEILTLPEPPKSLIVIGGGAVGVEFSSIFRSFGASVTLLEFLPRLVPSEDAEVSKELARVFKKRGINASVGARVESVERTEAGVRVAYTDSNGRAQTVEADKVLIAVGRAPRTADMGLETVGLVTDRGFLTVNEWMETAVQGVYALGDIVAGLPQLAHVGAMAGMVAAARVAGRPARPIRRNRIPACTYTEPQIGSAGLTEEAARQAGYEVKVGKFPFAGNSKATILGTHDGFVKIVADAKYGEILGVHILGPGATEIIAEAVAVMELEATVEDLMFTIHAHPTLAEAMLDGYAAVEGMAINA